TSPSVYISTDSVLHSSDITEPVLGTAQAQVAGPAEQAHMESLPGHIDGMRVHPPFIRSWAALVATVNWQFQLAVGL
ncbi:MAG: hypothetical protein O7A06_09260, partial [Acidobacteria bacterium]|nr:hypothetical protein [Acidobacteriota bacterium]